MPILNIGEEEPLGQTIFPSSDQWQATEITTEPASETALRRPATAERNARGEKARERYIEIGAALKAEAGITQHTAHKEMTGRASLATGAIFAPAGTTRRQL